MKKIIVLCVLLIVFSSFGLNKIVIPQRASAGSVITASKTNENLDTIASKFNKLIDSTAKFVRYEAISSGDSTLVADTAYMRTFTAGTAGITAANIDTSHIRHATADSTTIPIFKGNETHRGDSNYFAGIARFAGTLYASIADIDSLTGDVSNSGNFSSAVGCYATSINSQGTFIGVVKYQGCLPGQTTQYFPTLRTDYAYMYFSANAKNLGYYGNNSTQGNIFDINDSGSTTVKIHLASNGPSYFDRSLKVAACTTTTLNTGNGDNELYPMNQAVRTTDDPTFDSATVTDLKVTDDATIDDDLNVTGTITGNLTGNVTGNVSGSSGSCTGNAATATNGVVTTGSYANPAWITSLNGFKVCDTGSFACTLKTSDVTVQQIGTAYYSKIANVVTIAFPELLGTSNSTGLSIYAKIPFQPRYTSSGVYMFTGVMDIVDNSTGSAHRYFYTYEGGVTPNCFVYGGTFTSSGTKGVYPTNITYVTAD